MTSSQQHNNLGETIYRAREAKGLSSTKLAALVGVHHSAMARIQLGEIKQPRPGVLAAIARELDLDPNELFRVAGYDGDSRELPTFRGYLNTKFRSLPTTAVDELQGHLDYLIQKHTSNAQVAGNNERREHEHTHHTTKHRAEGSAAAADGSPVNR